MLSHFIATAMLISQLLASTVGVYVCRHGADLQLQAICLAVDTVCAEGTYFPGQLHACCRQDTGSCFLWDASATCPRSTVHVCDVPP